LNIRFIAEMGDLTVNQRSKTIVQISDPILAFLSLFIAYALIWRHDPHIAQDSFSARRSMQDICSLAIIAFCWHGLFAIAGLYRARLHSYFNIVGNQITRAALLSPLPVLACWMLTREQRRSSFIQALAMAGLAAALLPLLMIVSRMLLISFKRYLWLGNVNLRQVLVVGTNDRAMKFVHDSRHNPDCGHACVAFIDDGWYSQTPQEKSPIPLLGGLNDLPVLLRQRAIDEVVVTLPIASFYHETAGIVSLCETHGIRVNMIGQLFQSQLRRPLLAGQTTPLWAIHDPAWSEVSSFAKRLFDVALSATLLFICLPVFVGIALAILLTSDGPVFFRQTRLGLGKRHFEILKFRTMVADASEMIHQLEHLNETEGPTFKLKNDPRVTRVGSFLRKNSLDELPQLINVLIGDMSMVGPRPLPLRDYAGFSDDRHRRRFSVKPGITCLWQVMGRSNIRFDQWMALDSQYIDQRTFWLDMKILLQTLPAVLRGSGAV
jgi:exopolysaccharide biosynthesis polyprenyl glycosylphosphotransferase